MADSMEPYKMLWADPCCHGNEVWARRGDPVAYWLVYVAVATGILIFLFRFYRAMHFSAYARSWDRMSSVRLSV